MIILGILTTTILASGSTIQFQTKPMLSRWPHAHLTVVISSFGLQFLISASISFEKSVAVLLSYR